MKLSAAILLLSLMAGGAARGQETRDVAPPEPARPALETESALSLSDSLMRVYGWPDDRGPDYIQPTPGVYPDEQIRVGPIGSLDGGAITWLSSTASMPGMGDAATVAALYTREFGDFTVAAALYGQKYHFDRSVYSDYGLAGRVSYTLSDRFTLNAFGVYSAGNHYHSMAAMPYMAYSSYGGSVTYSPGGAFSIEAGVRRYYDPFSRQWVTVPVLAPSVRAWNCDFSVDFGGLLHQLLHSLVVQGRQNPTLSPAKAGAR